MLRRFLLALALVGLTLGITAQAQMENKSGSKDSSRDLPEIKGNPDILIKDTATRQAQLKRAFESFRSKLALLASRLENGSDKDKDKAKAIRKALKVASDGNTEARFDSMIRGLLKSDASKDIDALGGVISENAVLRKDLQAMIKLLTEDEGALNKEKAEKMARLLEQLKELIAKQERVKAQTEMARKSSKELGKDQNKVTKETKEAADGKKGGDDKKDGDDKKGEAKGEGKPGVEGKGEGREDTKTKGEGKAADKKDEGKPSDGKGEGKPSDGKDGKPGESKSGDGKGSESKDGKSGESKDSKDGGKDSKPGDGKPSGESKDGKPGDSKGGDGKPSGESKDGKSGEGKDGKPGDSKPSEGKPSDGKDGKPGEGKPGEGKDAKPSDGKGEGKPSAGKPSEGKPSESKPSDGKPGDGKGEGKPSDGKPGDGKPSEGKPSSGKGEGKPSDAKPGDQKPGESKGQGEGKGEAKPGKPSDGKPSDGKPSSGKGKPSEGKPGSGKPGSSSPPPPSGGDDQQKDDNPVKKQIEDANKYQKQAEDEIEKGKNDSASDKQADAIKKLEEAKKKLEELLKQMREEELERLLADLEKRCRYMLALQIEVRDGTVTLDKDIISTGSKPDVAHAARSNKLGDKEDEIVREAHAALKLIKTEGSAVAFAEVFEQVSKDMETAMNRLRRTDVGEVTQRIENDIIETLKEMIEALKKAQKDAKSPPPPPGKSPPPPPPGNKPLIDMLAELKMIFAMQRRVNARTELYGKQYKGEQLLPPAPSASDKEKKDFESVQNELKDLAGRQEKIGKVTKDIATGKSEANPK